MLKPHDRIFIRLVTIPECDEMTDGQTDTQTDGQTDTQTDGQNCSS